MYACTDVENAVPVCLNCNRHKASITFGHFTVSMTLSLPQRMSLSQMEAQKRFSLWDTGQHSGKWKRLWCAIQLYVFMIEHVIIYQPLIVVMYV